MSVLEKIRAEILRNRDEWIKGQDAEWHTYDRCLSIIDKYAEQEPRVKNELNVELNELKPCEDAVSRQAVLDAFAEYVRSGYADSENDFGMYCRIVNELPSVQPKGGAE